MFDLHDVADLIRARIDHLTEGLADCEDDDSDECEPVLAERRQWISAIAAVREAARKEQRS